MAVKFDSKQGINFVAYIILSSGEKGILNVATMREGAIRSWETAQIKE